jgi:hypothetical protein
VVDSSWCGSAVVIGGSEFCRRRVLFRKHMPQETRTFSHMIDLDHVTMEVKSIAFGRPLLTADE